MSDAITSKRPQTKTPRFISAIHWTLGVLGSGWIVGQIFRDDAWITGLCFYIPSVIVLGVSLACLLGAIRHRTLSRLLVTSVVTVILANQVFMVENRFRSQGNAQFDQRDLRVVHWNVFRGYAGWDRIRDALATHAADVYVLSEIPNSIEPGFPGYKSVRISNMAVLVKGSISGIKRIGDLGDLKLFTVTCNTQAGSIRLFVADMSSNIMVHRDPLLRELVRQIKHCQPDVVVGACASKVGEKFAKIVESPVGAEN